MKMRLDQRVVALGLAESGEQARRLILAGRVRVGGRVGCKAGMSVRDAESVELIEAERYVGRGGEKMEGALRTLSIDVQGCSCLDVGASTGGFTDCLLQHGALRVVAVDVGRGQLHWRLRNDARVQVVEGCNARGLRLENVGQRPDVATVDVSFISLRKVLPAVCEVLAPQGRLLALVKPQFEAGPECVGRGGVVRDEQARDAAIEGIKSFVAESIGLVWLGGCDSALRGPAGNLEYFGYWRKP